MTSIRLSSDVLANLPCGRQSASLRSVNALETRKDLRMPQHTSGGHKAWRPEAAGKPGARASVADHPRVCSPCRGMKLVHAAEPDSLVQRRGAEAADLDAGLAGPQRRVGVGGDLLVAVGRPDRHQLGAR